MDKDVLAEALDAFRDAEEAESDNRKSWVADMRFAMLGEQWDETAKTSRGRNRPMLTMNRMPAFIRQVTNDARQNKPSIKCHPVGDGANKHTSMILNGLIRNIEYTSNADVAYDTALEHAVGGGFGYIRMTSQYASDDAFDQDLMIERVPNPLAIYGDPASMAADSSDWNTCFIVDPHTEAEFKRKWPKAKAIDFGDSGKDERLSSWLSSKESVRVAEYWTRDDVPTTIYKIDIGTGAHQVVSEKRLREMLAEFPGLKVVGNRETTTKKVTQRIINGAEVLETNAWAGRYIPIIPVYGGEVVIEGKRTFKSLIRDAKDAQRMFNYWRTTTTELVALAPRAPWVGKLGFANSDARWKSANTENHAYLEYAGDMPPQRQGFEGPPAGALQEALNAADDMKSIIGMYDASLGARSNETSGRAIVARQREGDTSTFNFVDNLSRAIRHLGRVVIDMIPHVYTTERIIRVIHEDGTNDAVPINQELPPGPMPGIPQHMQEQQQDQQEHQEGMSRIYDLTAGKYDITCEAGPSFATRRQEAATQMTEFVRAFPAAAPIIGDLIAKNLDWPGADEIAGRLKAMLPPQLQGKNPQAQMLQQQMQQMDGAAKQAIAQLQGELQQCQQALQRAQSQVEAEKMSQTIDELKVKIDAYKAITDRLQAGIELTQGATEEMVPMIADAQAMAGRAQQLGAANGVEIHKAQAQVASAQAVAQAVAGLGQMIEKLLEPRPVQRDAEGLITMH